MDTQTKKAATDLIKPLECVNGIPNLKAYRDIAGVLTNGYGNTRNVVDGSTITADQAEADFQRNLQECDDVYNRTVSVALTPNQHAAALSFIFNEGAPAWENSTLLKVINGRQWDLVKAQWEEWDKYHDEKGKLQTSPGLQRRRAAEIALWFTPVGADGPEDSRATVGTGAAAIPPQPTNVLQTSTGKQTTGVIVGSVGTAGAIVNEAMNHANDTLTQVGAVAGSASGVFAALKNVNVIIALVAVTAIVAFAVWGLIERRNKLKETKQ